MLKRLTFPLNFSNEFNKMNYYILRMYGGKGSRIYLKNGVSFHIWVVLSLTVLIAYK